MLSRVKGCLLAGACGDALGGEIEFMSLRTIREKFGPNGLTDMVLHNGSARITDDTQMSVYTAQGLLDARKKNCDYHDTLVEIHKSYLRWSAGQLHTYDLLKRAPYDFEELKNDELTKDGKNKPLTENRAPGNTCISALAAGKFFTRDPPANYSKGCGTVMRVAPIGIYAKTLEEAYMLGCDSSALTHGHILGWTAGGALCVLLRLILDGEPLEKATNSMLEFIEAKPECKNLVPFVKRAMETARLKKRGCEAFIKLGEGWVAEEALAIGIWAALLNPTDTRQALLDAVNHPGDSDSTGAIAGYIIGAANGVESIPKEWLEHLELRDLIEKQAEELLN